MTDLTQAFEDLKKATCPEDIWPTFPTIHDYRKWVNRVHPDRFMDSKEKKMAQEAFKLFRDLWINANEKQHEGTYGNKHLAKEIILSSKTGSYTLGKLIAEGDLSDVYMTSDSLTVKIGRTPANNDLLIAESKSLKHLNSKKLYHIPELVDSFVLTRDRKRCQVNVIRTNQGESGPGYLLDEIIKSYPEGIDSRDAAWMFNRLMGALIQAHDLGIVHGAIVPSHFIVFPDNHNGMLIDWCYSMKTNSKLKAIVPKFKEYYPGEVFIKGANAGQTALDIYMAAKCFVALVGGNLKLDTMPKSVPLLVQGCIRACLLGPTRRNNDAWRVYVDFDQALKLSYGPKKFRAFTMPPKERKP